MRDPKPLGCIHYVYHKGERGGAEEFRRVLKVFEGKRGDGTEKFLKNGRGIAIFSRCH